MSHVLTQGDTLAHTPQWSCQKILVGCASFVVRVFVVTQLTYLCKKFDKNKTVVSHNIVSGPESKCSLKFTELDRLNIRQTLINFLLASIIRTWSKIN